MRYLKKKKERKKSKFPSHMARTTDQRKFRDGWVSSSALSSTNIVILCSKAMLTVLCFHIQEKCIVLTKLTTCDVKKTLINHVLPGGAGVLPLAPWCM